MNLGLTSVLVLSTINLFFLFFLVTLQLLDLPTVWIWNIMDAYACLSLLMLVS